MNTSTDVEGGYIFDSVFADANFSVVFAREWNMDIYTESQVASWAWLEGLALSGGSAIELPDLEIGLKFNSQAFGPVSPPLNASYSAESISSDYPLTFEWASYPGDTRYWVDLGREGERIPVWQSYVTWSTTASFYGVLDDGRYVSPGWYWWRVGVRKQVGIYKLFVYSSSSSLVIEP